MPKRDTKYLWLRDGTWWINCRLPNVDGLPITKRHLRFSLGTTSYQVAKNIRDRALLPLLTASHLREGITKLITLLADNDEQITRLMGELAAEADLPSLAGIKAAGLTPVPVPVLIERYLDYLRSTKAKAPGSIKKYAGSAPVWEELLGQVDAQTLTNTQVAKARDELLTYPRSYFIRSAATRNKTPQEGEDTISARTIHSHLRLLSAAFDWGIADGLIVCRNPVTGVSIQFAEASPKKCPTPIQADALCRLRKTSAAVGALEWHAIPIIARYTGARFAEIVALTTDDFPTVTGVQCLSINDDHRHKRVKTSQSRRLIPIAPRLAPVIDHLLATNKGGRLFRHAGDSADGTKLGNTLNGKYNEAAKAIGPFSFHCFRVYANTLMTQAGVDIIDRERILGHKNRLTQSAYTPADLSRYLEAMQQIEDQERRHYAEKGGEYPDLPALPA